MPAVISEVTLKHGTQVTDNTSSLADEAQTFLDGIWSDALVAA